LAKADKIYDSLRIAPCSFPAAGDNVAGSDRLQKIRIYKNGDLR
jgi:hypothetical protein